MTAGARLWFCGPTSVLAGALCVALTFVSSADAQIQNSDQRGCIVAINKSAAKLAKAQGRQVASCFKDATTGVLPAASLQACVSDAGSKVAKALAKLTDQDAKRCGELPSFGYSGAATAGSVVLSQELASVADLFGDDLAAALITATTDADGARCQSTIAKRYARVTLEAVRAFNDCKKRGLGDGSIDSTEDLAACLGAVVADSRGKIGKAIEKLGKDYAKRCVQPLGDPTAAIPGVCQSAQDPHVCMSEHLKCRACLELRNVDNVALDCESFDNGSVDASCIDPDADECAGENGGDNCHENATCTDETDGFSCECDAGYEGDGVVCTDIDECAEGTDTCHANAICTNNDGGFDCACALGYSGDGFTCIDIDECATGTDNCHVNATCANTQGGFICTCIGGYQGDGVTCTDIDECATGTDNCDANATCTNSVGSFSCACNAGFLGDGVTCVDIDECGQGTDNCDTNATCTNIPGSFSCTCLPGWQGDGVTCVDIDECGLGIDNCHVEATCTNLLGSFSCSCNTGYSGDGVLCVDDNECIGEGSGNNCSVNADCLNLAGSFDCECAKGNSGIPFGAVCSPITVALTSPTHGVFTQAGSIGITGQVTVDDTADVSLTINGLPATVQANGSFTASIGLDPGIVFNEVRAVLTHTPTGYVTRDRRVVIVGPSKPFGGLVEESVGLRINDSGFDALEPILTSLVDFDVSTLLPAGTNVLTGGSICVQDSFLGCIASVDSATISSSSLGGFGIDIDSMVNFVAGDIQLTNLFVDVEVGLTISGIGTTCDSFAISTATTNILGDYALEPDPGDPNVIDVNQLGNVQVVFGGFNENVDCGGIGFLTFLINLVGADVQGLMQSSFEGFLNDPDGAGPQDAVIAQAIEDALDAVELTGPIGEGFGVNLDTPLFAIPEDNNGLTLASGAIMSTLVPAPGAPTFPVTLHIPQTYPFTEISTGTTPEGGIPYGMGIGIGESGFNQILAALVESGSMNAEITELDLTGGGTPLPITAGLFAFLVPEFSQLDPATALALRITPTLAPVLTGLSGPSGEVADLIISHLLVDIIEGAGTGSEILHGRMALDAAAAFDLTIQGGNLVPEITAPAPEDVAITLLDNPLCIDEGTLQTTVPALIGPLVPQLAGAFGAFPLPTFLGLQPTALEVSRVGDFLGVFLDVVPAP